MEAVAPTEGEGDRRREDDMQAIVSTLVLFLFHSMGSPAREAKEELIEIKI